MAINNQPTIKPRTVTGLFTKYIPKVIPLAFDESMSYYECLCALLDYINKNVIPALDNNAEGLLELQEFYTELQSYVNNYFDNLDVQEEINNKLDAMVEDGTLNTLIANYLVGLGVNVKFFGAVGDGQTDDTSAINTALQYCKTNNVGSLFFPDGEYVVSDDLVIDFSNITIHGSSKSVIKYAGLGTSGNIIYLKGTEESPIENININNLRIDCTNQTYKGGASLETPALTAPNPYAQGLRGIFVNFAINVTIDNIQIYDLYGDGIRIQRCHTVLVNNCKLNDTGGGNIVAGGPTGYDNFGDGIVAFECFDVQFTNNTVINQRTYLTPTANGYICGRSGLEFEYGLTTDGVNTPDYDLFDFTDSHGLVMDNNYVYGYTKGIHLEAESTACHITDNSVIHCNIGLMNTISGKTSYVGNYFNSDGVGPAYQGGYDGYYCGIAISEYTNSDPTRTNILVNGNIFEGNSIGVIVGRDYVTLSNNTFRNTSTTGAIHTNKANLHDIAILSNQFYNTTIHLYSSKGVIIANNICLNSSKNFILMESCDNTIINGNSFDNQVYFTGVCKKLVISNNIIKARNDNETESLLKGYETHYGEIRDNLVDLSSNDTTQFIRINSGRYNSITGNEITVSNTRTITVNKFPGAEIFIKIADNHVTGNNPLLYLNELNYDVYNLVLENNKMEEPTAYVYFQTAGGTHGRCVIQNNKGLLKFNSTPNVLNSLKGQWLEKGEIITKYTPSASSFAYACTNQGYYVDTAWATSTAYTKGRLVLSNGYVYKCVVAGTSSTAPTSTTVGEIETTADNIQWLCCGTVATLIEI